jgi:beta-galactosidase
MRRLLLPAVALLVLLMAHPHAGQAPTGRAPDHVADTFPIAVWYGGGTARAPMLERDPHGRREAWRKDLEQIKALGFRTVRAWIDWASGEPEPGRYTFDTLDVLVRLAEELDLQVLVQVYMDSAPGWMGRAHPDARFVSSNGQAIDPESSPGYCLDHAAVRKADLAFYRAFAERFGKSRALVGVDLWSEPHVINWANPTYIPNPEFCFCPNTRARFREWVRQKYGTLDAVNTAWYRRYASWDEVEPNRLSTILSYTDYIDWKAFIRDKLAEDLRARYEAVKTAAPHLAVVSHAAGVGLFASPHWWEGQSDDWSMAAQVDYYGTSFYPKHSAFVDRDVPWRAALLDFTRSFGYAEGRRGFWIGELQGGFGTIALNVSPTVTPGDLRTWTWSALARGARGIAYYAWYPMSSGYESGGFGLINLDGTVTERSRAAGEIARLVAANERLFLEARPPRAEVAIVYNPLVHFVGGRQRATAYGGPQGEVAGIERDSLLGIHRALFPTHVQIDYVHADHVTADKLAQYRLVFLAYPPMMPARLADALRGYVEQGGALVAEARAGWNDERGLAAPIIPGLGLHEVLGCRETAVQTGAGGRTTLRWTGTMVPGVSAGDLLPARWYEETLEPLGPQAQVVAEFEDGRPAAVVSTFGKGKTLTLGSYVSAAYQSRPDEAVASFYAGLLDWAGVPRPARVEPAGLEVKLLERGGERLVFLVNHGQAPAEARVWLALDPSTGWSGADLASGAPVASTPGPGGLWLPVRVGPMDAQVVHLVRN